MSHSTWLYDVVQETLYVRQSLILTIRRKGFYTLKIYLEKFYFLTFGNLSSGLILSVFGFCLL